MNYKSIFYILFYFLLRETNAVQDNNIVVTKISERFGLAEGPYWNHRTQNLYFVDIYNQKLCRLDIATGSITSAYIANGPLGFAIPVEDSSNLYVAGSGTDLVLITWDSESNSTNPKVEILATVDKDRSGTRFNDGKVDSAGRLWAGTMGAEVNSVFTPNQGSLYRFASDKIPKKQISPVGISNGLAWSLEDDIFYYIDSLSYQVVSYKFDVHTGDISDKKVIFDMKKNNITGIPDGMTIDTRGNLWIAVYSGSCILQVDSKAGKLLRKISIPAERVTSVAFGGPLLDILYVTTSSYGLSIEELETQPNAGCLFAVTGLGVQGFLPNAFKLH